MKYSKMDADNDYLHMVYDLQENLENVLLWFEDNKVSRSDWWNWSHVICNSSSRVDNTVTLPSLHVSLLKWSTIL